MSSRALGCPGFSGCGPWALECELSSCGVRAWLLHGLAIFLDQGQNLSSALAGGFCTTDPQGSPREFFFFSEEPVIRLE